MSSRPLRDAPGLVVPVALLLVSGCTALVYQVVWMRQLSGVFGNTAHAAAVTLAGFFVGVMTGARWWGRRAETTRRPLYAYGLLEAGVAAGAVAAFLVLANAHEAFGTLYRGLRHAPTALVLTKLVLSGAVLLPPAFFMGGTLPMMVQHVVRRADRLGAVGALLYGANTLGAASGAMAAAFVLAPAMGYAATLGSAVALTLGVAAWACWSGRATIAAPARTWAPPGAPVTGAGVPRSAWLASLAALSGFGTLALEVLWTRMFAQVLQNSVYTFACVVTVVLLALAVGALASSWLSRQSWSPEIVLAAMLAGAAVAAAVVPFSFSWLTDGLRYAGGAAGFAGYVATVLGLVAVVLLPAGVVLGAVFPYLLRASEPIARSAGRSVGDLVSLNLAGSVAGSLVAGFVVLDGLGLWAGMRLVASLYAVASLAALIRIDRSRRVRVLAAAATTTAMILVSPTRLPTVALDTANDERLLGVWEGSAGIVSVLQRPGSLAMTLDGDYTLGDTAAARDERLQAELALALHPHPTSAFFLGLGTGITAGAALRHPDVDRLVVAELSPQVVAAARTFFGPFDAGLFDDPRVAVVVDDGRSYLSAAGETFDVVVADLFMPWRAGVGGAYSLDHYRRALPALRPGGLYVQWLPAYQLSRTEFGIIARTMVEAFAQVTAWRGTLDPGLETIALVGQRDAAPLVVDRSRSAGGGDRTAGAVMSQHELLARYAGNLSAARALVEGHSLNTDDRPVIDFTAPVTHRRVRSGDASWLVGRELAELFATLLEVSHPNPIRSSRAFRRPTYASCGQVWASTWRRSSMRQGITTGQARPGRSTRRCLPRKRRDRRRRPLRRPGPENRRPPDAARKAGTIGAVSLRSVLRTVFTLGRGVATGLPAASADRDPIELFEEWFAQARDAGIMMPEAMTLATAASDGRPSARMVLLKGVDRRGFVFYTNYESRKARELDANPQAALVFHWTVLERQVRIEGRVERTSEAESFAYFKTRLRGSRIGAWASKQSRPLEHREAFDAEVARYEARFKGGDVPLPPFWGGFRVVPDAIEFWQGRVNRLHDRLCFQRNGEAWETRRLYP